MCRHEWARGVFRCRATAEPLRDVRLSPDNAFEYEPSYILRGLSALALDVVRE